MRGVTFVIVAAAALHVAGLPHGRVTAAEPAWPAVCDTQATGWNQTRCQEGHTCCSSQYSGSLLGCCPFENAVCCEANKLTCCPAGTKCVDSHTHGWPGWGVVTTCEPAVEAGHVPGAPPPASAASQGVAVCKPGPPLPLDPTRKNVLVIGDSVSIGYTPFVASDLQDVALVQHAPWGGDGGAEETAYGLQCLDYFTAAPSGLPLTGLDLIYFNWGLHDGPQLFNEPPANVTIPGQEGNMTVYKAQLTQIAAKLKGIAARIGAKLLFGITSPVICRLQADNDVQWLNEQASSVMQHAGIATVDLHAAIVGKCGPAPQVSCFGETGGFCPHSTPTGYAWLANSTVAPAIRGMLSLRLG